MSDQPPFKAIKFTKNWQADLPCFVLQGKRYQQFAVQSGHHLKQWAALYSDL
jgi:hypothetical protein